MGKLIEVKEAEFKKIIESEKGIVLIDFYADWCGPCKTLSPILHEVADEVEDITILKVDVDDNQTLSAEYGVRSIPIVFAVKNGEKLDKFVGNKSKNDIISFIENIKKEDEKIKK